MNVSRQMSFTLTQATEIAKHQLLSCGSDEIEVQLLSEKTEEYDVGWVFYYQSAHYLETGNFSDSLVGNAPIFVSRSDGHAFFINHHRPMAESLSAYRVCGNPNAQEVPEVRLTGWRKGAPSVSAIQAVREHSTIGLVQAKSVVDSCLANQLPVVMVPSVADAKALVSALASAGFEAEVRYDG